jgi:hypothetical protein
MKRILVAIVAVGLLTGAAEARHVPWCGIYARSHLVNSDPGARFNLACNWRHYGSATYAHEGALVVWCNGRHRHVGKITGPCNGSVCIVTSGNDGGAVRTRARSVASASFRM